MTATLLTQSLAVAVGGFLSSAHCIGMCGGFAAAVGASRAPVAPLLARQFVYNLGRVFTYAFLGAVAGSTGLYLSQWQLAGIDLQRAFALLAGILMIGLGLSALGILRLPASWTTAANRLLSPVFAYFLNARGVFGYFLGGIANGFLPCGLVYAFLAVAAASGDSLHGSVLMVAFGFGTMPAMLLVGCGARLATPAFRKRVHRVAAIFVVALGVITLYRGWPRPTPDCCRETIAPPALSLRG